MQRTPKLEAMDIAGIRRAIVERKRLVLTAVAGFAVLGIGLNVFTPPVYRASVRIEFRQPPERSPWTGQPASGSFQSENVALYTSAELITNRVILGRLAADMIRPASVLAVDSGDEAYDTGWPAWLRVPTAGASKPVAGPGAPVAVPAVMDPIRLDAQIDGLQRVIRVEPVRDTRLVDIQVEDSHPERARHMADRVAQLFVDYQVQRSVESDTSGLGYLLVRIDEVKARIEAANAKLQRSGRANPAVQESRASHLRGTVSTLERDLIDAETRLAAARATYKDKHPKLVAMQSEARTLRGRIGAETRRMYAAEAGVGQLRQGVLESELLVDQDLYTRLVARAREMGLDRQMTSPAVAVVAPAAVDRTPVRPRGAINLVVCLVTGLLVGVGLALVGDSTRRTIRNADDIEEQLELPVLAEIAKH